MMGFLEDIAKSNPVCRVYYGDDFNNKPNDHCYWSDMDYLTGWYENDNHFRERLNKVIYANEKGNND